MTKEQIKEELTKLEIEFDPASPKAVLEALLPVVESGLPEHESVDWVDAKTIKNIKYEKKMYKAGEVVTLGKVMYDHFKENGFVE
jgi:hypothetical protein